MTSWPVRSAICLDCRTALPAGATCPHGAHRVASLRDADGREALLTRVWGSRSVRKHIAEAGRAGGVSGGGASLLDGCSACDLGGGDFHVLAVLLVVFAAVFVLWFAGRRIVEAIRARRRRRMFAARGAVREPLAGRPTGTGTIVAYGPLAPAPLDGTPCVAFGLRLVHHDGGLHRGPQTMLRDGATAGFEIALDSGLRARIPAGACALDLAAARTVRPSALDDYLLAVDPQRATTDDLDPFPCDRIELATLAPGDRVEILTPLAPIPDAAPTGYREARVIMVPDGPVRLRRLATSSAS